MTIIVDDPRKNAIEALRASVSTSVWTSNKQFVSDLKAEIKQHALASNPIIDVFNQGLLSLEAVKTIHLEYRHAIVQIFTDALLMAQFQTRQLEPRLSPGSKMPARFLLTLNVLDEFGFQPGYDQSNYYKGNPAYAHYPLFEKVLDDLGVSDRERLHHIPSQIAADVRNFLELSFPNYNSVVALLAVAEEQVILYSPPLRESVKAIGGHVADGYYHVHGVTTDHGTEAADDDHEDDLWYALMQAATSDQYDQIRYICLAYCDLWDKFWTFQYNVHCRHLFPTPLSALAENASRIIY
ncbi:iron-containing redox enzyme family protein [Aquirhabdus parva]|uniref:iron-containing redox enzyme family protein n=1 Tax=Aquirhabdus parva TaxID=2283318 RepID=UPI001D18CEC8|nr:iron-containing redox enzyme family protein [Aquirhabdus parva]